MHLTCEFEENGQKVMKSYKYEDLKSLQSKLTLVAADKQRENRDAIQKFNEVCYESYVHISYTGIFFLYVLCYSFAILVFGLLAQESGQTHEARLSHSDFVDEGFDREFSSSLSGYQS